MARGMVVRFATLADLDFVQQDGYVPAEAVKRKIEWREVMVAELDNTLVGYLRIEYLWSRVPYIELIFVVPEHRKQGVGTAMLHFVESFLRDKGHDVLYSSSQADEPEPQEWHCTMGFEECGSIAGINQDGIAELFFHKRLR